MTILVGFIALAAIYGIVGVSLSIKRVPPGHARNATRLPLTYARWETEGEKHRTLGSGWHLVIPGRDQVSGPIDLRERGVSLNGRRLLTADGASVTVDATLSFLITDPLAEFTVGDQKQAVEKLVAMMLSQIIGSTGLEQTLAARDKVSAALRERLANASATLGIRVNSVEVRSIAPTPDTGTDGPTGLMQPELGIGEDAMTELLRQVANERYERAQQKLERLERGWFWRHRQRT